MNDNMRTAVEQQVANADQRHVDLTPSVELNITLENKIMDGCYMLDFEGKIMLYDNEKKVQVGSIEVTKLLLGEMFESGDYLFSVLDERQETYWLVELFDDEDEYTPAVKRLTEGGPYSDNILLLSVLKIAPAFRGHNLGLFATEILIRNFGSDCGLVAFKPFPLQYSGSDSKPEPNPDYDMFCCSFEEGLSKLKRYYRKGGFKSVPGTDLMIVSNELRNAAIERYRMDRVILSAEVWENFAQGNHSI